MLTVNLKKYQIYSVFDKRKIILLYISMQTGSCRFRKLSVNRLIKYFHIKLKLGEIKFLIVNQYKLC